MLLSQEEHIQHNYIEPVVSRQVPVLVRSVSDYQAVDLALSDVRTKRKQLAAYMKEEPADLSNLRPGEGLCFLTRKSWESANGLFNKFDGILKSKDEELTASLKKWQLQEYERVRREEEKKREAAEAIAAAERDRLRAEAEAERKRLDAEAAAERARLDELAKQARENKNREEAKRLTELAKATEARIQQEAQERQMELQQQAADIQVQEVFVETRAPEDTSMRFSKKYTARVTDMNKLCRSIADGKFSESLVKPNDGDLNRLANAMKGKNPPPGVIFEEDLKFGRKAVR